MVALVLLLPVDLFNSSLGSRFSVLGESPFYLNNGA